MYHVKVAKEINLSIHPRVEVIKELSSQTTAYPRNLISGQQKCFLQFEAFPVSSQSVGLPVHRQITFWLLLSRLQQQAAVWKWATEMLSRCISMVSAESVWKWTFDVYPAAFLSGATDRSRCWHTFIHCSSSCSSHTMKPAHTSHSRSRETNRSRNVFIFC